MARALSILLFISTCGVISAATLEQLSLPEMAQQSTAVVRASVTGISASFTGSTIYTHYKLNIEETWKGFAPKEVLLPGGVAGGYSQTFPGVPQLQTGRDYVLFLWTSPAGITHLLGLSQGLFDVAGMGDSALISRGEIGEMMLDKSGRPVKDSAVQMRLLDFKTRVGRALLAAGFRQ